MKGLTISLSPTFTPGDPLNAHRLKRLFNSDSGRKTGFVYLDKATFARNAGALTSSPMRRPNALTTPASHVSVAASEHGGAVAVENGQDDAGRLPNSLPGQSVSPLKDSPNLAASKNENLFEVTREPACFQKQNMGRIIPPLGSAGSNNSSSVEKLHSVSTMTLLGWLLLDPIATLPLLGPGQPFHELSKSLSAEGHPLASRFAQVRDWAARTAGGQIEVDLLPAGPHDLM